MKNLKKNFLVWLIIGFVLSSFYNVFTKSNNNVTVQNLAFSDFLNDTKKFNPTSEGVSSGEISWPQ